MPIMYGSPTVLKPLPKIIYLFGKRQGHGKDTCCDILSDILKRKNIYHYRSMFAKTLKKQVAERYGLDLFRMESQEYKSSIVPHVAPKIVYTDNNGKEVPYWVYMDPGKLTLEQKTVPRTVRDILIEEGKFARSIWGDTWAWQAYNEIYGSGAEIGFISDYRFKNESDEEGKIYELFVSKAKEKGVDLNIYARPKIIRIQVYRPDGIFKDDGADNELPDDFSFYDYNIMNEPRSDWRENLKRQIEDILAKTYGG